MVDYAKYMMEWLRVMERFAEAEELKTDEEKVYVSMSDTLASVGLFLGAKVYRDENGFFMLLNDLKKLKKYDEIKELVENQKEINKLSLRAYKDDLKRVDEFKREMKEKKEKRRMRK
ncbi:MAG: hypothetical protein QFX40_03330 [Archaeoglobales archaeon]|nr:hypothetical protein [Archaeoglobales archaeon]